jgi:hypothetical protein
VAINIVHPQQKGLLDQILDATPPVAKGAPVALRPVETTGNEQAEKKVALPPVGFDGVTSEKPERPSHALSGPPKIISRHFLPETLPARTAKLPPTHTLKSGKGSITFAHDSERKLTITALNAAGGKDGDPITKAVSYAEGARYAHAFVAALSVWENDGAAEFAASAARRATDAAVLLERAQRSAFEAAGLLRSLLPSDLVKKGAPIEASLTSAEQFGLAGVVARKVNHGPGTAMENAVALEAQVTGHSLLDGLVLNSAVRGAQNVGAAVLNHLSDGQADVSKGTQRLTGNDARVVAHVDGRDVTEGEIRELALRDSDAVEFTVDGLTNGNNSESPIEFHLQRAGDNIKWQFYGRDGEQMKLYSGDFSPTGLKGFVEGLKAQQRYDRQPLKLPNVDFVNALAEAALTTLRNESKAARVASGESGGLSYQQLMDALQAPTR